MRPIELKTKIFLDSGDPNETKKVIDMIGFLDGQTTNPSLIAKNPKAVARINQGKKFSKQDIFSFYKDIIQEIHSVIPLGDISIEVYADDTTQAEEMIEQAELMNTWIPNARIKLPILMQGLVAAQALSKKNIKLNMTLCFSQEQAAAVYSASINSIHSVFVSPFQARLNDNGKNGMDLIKNILKMYNNSDHHVKVLSASIRDLSHFLYTLYIKSDIVTIPLKVIEEWSSNALKIPVNEYYDQNISDDSNLTSIEYIDNINLSENLEKYNVKHELTKIGIEKFKSDWNNLIIN